MRQPSHPPPIDAPDCAVILTAASSLFRIGVALRNRAYDRGWFRATDAGAPVISVGNISVGGTGKTPVVEHLLNRLLSKGIRTAVVTRGYRRKTRGSIVVSDGAGHIVDVRSGGDEPVQMARKFPGAVIVADEVRSRGCRLARDTHRAEAIILDDGFQHRRCARDVDIAVVDSQTPERDLRLLPAGRLREPFRNLRRADLVLLTRCEPGWEQGDIYRSLRTVSDAPVASTQFHTASVRSISGEGYSADDLRGRRIFRFCGVGSPESFRCTAAALGVLEAGHMHFPDHHEYTEGDVSRILDRFRRCGAEALLTTEKDAVRLGSHYQLLSDIPLFYPLLAMKFLAGEEEFHRVIDSCLSARRRHHIPEST